MVINFKAIADAVICDFKIREWIAAAELNSWTYLEFESDGIKLKFKREENGWRRF